MSYWLSVMRMFCQRIQVGSIFKEDYNYDLDLKRLFHFVDYQIGVT